MELGLTCVRSCLCAARSSAGARLLVSQMFTRDVHHMSQADAPRMLGTMPLPLPPMRAATLTPNIGAWLQNLAGMLRI